MGKKARKKLEQDQKRETKQFTLDQKISERRAFKTGSHKGLLKERKSGGVRQQKLIRVQEKKKRKLADDQVRKTQKVEYNQWKTIQKLKDLQKKATRKLKDQQNKNMKRLVEKFMREKRKLEAK